MEHDTSSASCWPEAVLGDFMTVSDDCLLPRREIKESIFSIRNTKRLKYEVLNILKSKTFAANIIGLGLF